MLLTYFDEVKYQAGRQPYYWLGAIIVDAQCIFELEAKVNALADEAFGTKVMSRETEFHASDLFNANAHFKGWSLDRRLHFLKELITIFGNAKTMSKVYVRLDPEKMVSSEVEEIAFMFLVERVDGVLKSRRTPGMLIGDRESETIAGKFSEKLSNYRAHGTDFHYGKSLQHLLDTVHFTHSHHSRMLQMADLHVWLRQLEHIGDQGKWHRMQVIKHIQSIDFCLAPASYKKWPTDDSWLKIPTTPKPADSA